MKKINFLRDMGYLCRSLKDAVATRFPDNPAAWTIAMGALIFLSTLAYILLKCFSLLIVLFAVNRIHMPCYCITKRIWVSGERLRTSWNPVPCACIKNSYESRK